jgi:hypothetical protein
VDDLVNALSRSRGGIQLVIRNQEGLRRIEIR